MGKVPVYTGRHVERLFDIGTVTGMTDSQLLAQFVSGDNESASQAFEAIIKRHGRMVYRVCREVLQSEHAAEDAFQATFLVLARKARALQASERLGNWLYGVALRTARKGKTLANRHQVLDKQAAASRTSVAESRYSDQVLADLKRVLHEEIDRLPTAYRAAIVVCYLEGLSQTQAAQQLHLTESTVRGRLARARKLLGQRLTRRGVGPNAGLAALENSMHAGGLLRNSLAESTTRSVLCSLNRSLAISNVVSGMACDIADGVIRTMWFSSIKTMALALTVVALFGSGAALIIQQPANARVWVNEAQPSSFAPLEVPQAKDAPRSADQIQNKEQQPGSPAIGPELERLVAGPIVRTIPISKDCMVLSYLPDWNFGNVDNIGIGNNDGGVRTFLDWPAIPADEASKPDRRFLLALYSRKTISYPPASAILAFEVLEQWPERTSWKTKPRCAPEAAATFEFKPGDGWKLFDVTPLVRARAVAGQTSHGIVLRFLKEDISGGSQEVFSDYKLVSREGADEWIDKRPLLLVVKTAMPIKN